MKKRTRISSLLVLVVLLIGAANFAGPACGAQTPASSAKDETPDLQAFVGTWTATYRGEALAVLVLREYRGGLAGTLNNFDLSVDKDGNLSDGTHEDQGDAPLLNARFKDGALLFVVMQKDQYQPSTEWKFVSKSNGEGELTPVVDYQIGGPKDVVVKPIRMIRERAKP